MTASYSVDILGCLKVSVIMVTMVHTMVSVLITSIRGNYIDFQLKMVLVSGKRFWVGVSTPMTASYSVDILGCLKVSVVTILHTMVSVLITCFRGIYTNYQLKMV